MKRFSRWCRTRIGALVDWAASTAALRPRAHHDVLTAGEFIKYMALDTSARGFLDLVGRRGGPRSCGMRDYCTCVEARLFKHPDCKTVEVMAEMRIVRGRPLTVAEDVEFDAEMLALARRAEIENRWPWLRRAAAAT